MSWNYLQFAGENGDWFELIALLLLELLAIGSELVEQMVDDVGLEDFNAHMVGVILSVSFYFYVEC